MSESVSSRLRGLRHQGLRIAVFLLLALAFAAGSWAANPVRVAPSAALQMQALKGIKTSKTAMQNKIDSRLYLGLLKQRGDARLTSLTDFRFVKPEADGKVPVDIVLTNAAGIKAVINKLDSLGGVVKAKSPSSAGCTPASAWTTSSPSPEWRRCARYASTSRA